MIVCEGIPMVSMWGRCTVLSLITVACICLCIALMTETGSGDSSLNHLNVIIETSNSTVVPNGSVNIVHFSVAIQTSYYEPNISYDIMLRINDPNFSRYEFNPGIFKLLGHRESWGMLKVYVPEDILAGTHEIPVSAHALSNNGSYRVIKVGFITIKVLENRNVPVEFVGGNIVPYYPDIPQITHHLLLSNEGNTVERVICRYLSDGEEINISVWDRKSTEEVGPLRPIELSPGEYVAIDVVFFIDGIPDKDGMIPITIEVVASEDAWVIGSLDSQVFKLPKDEGEESLDWVLVILSVAVVVLLALTILLWRRGGHPEAPSS